MSIGLTFTHSAAAVSKRDLLCFGTVEFGALHVQDFVHCPVLVEYNTPD